MNRTVTIKVLHADIQAGQHHPKKSCKTCPIAMAMGRTTGCDWGVSRSGAWCEEYGRISFPEFVTRWVDTYDEAQKTKRKVNPISFPIKLDRRNV